MRELLFIRHAETDLAGTFCGHSDPPVNARGEKQIEQLIAGLSFQRPYAVVSSDLQRASSTAARISEAFRVPSTTIPELREIDFGIWEGLRWQEIEALDANEARKWADTFPSRTPPNGESFKHFRKRVLHAVSLLETQGGPERLAVVTHGGVMRLVLQELLQRTAEEAWVITKPYCAWFTYAPSPVRKEISE